MMTSRLPVVLNRINNRVSNVPSRLRSTVAEADSPFIVTLFPGHGIGPEIATSVQAIFNAADVPIEWDVHHIDVQNAKPGQDIISKDALDSLRRNRFGLKGPMATPIGKGYRSLNLTLRKELGLYANIRPCLSIPGVKTPYPNVDVVTVRENTEGEYSGLEHVVYPGVVESLKVITRDASLRVCHYAFDYALRNNRRVVTAVHKATVMKMSDGLFLECAKEVAEQYASRGIQFQTLLIDNAASFLVSNPSLLDVMVMPNLYGDIISDLCAGLVGGLGLTPSANMGTDCMLAEAVHGTAPDIAGKNLANPTALLLSSVLMLREMHLIPQADLIQSSLQTVLRLGQVRTGDIGGTATTTEFTDAIIRQMDAQRLHSHA